MQSSNDNYFSKLNAINVSEHIEKKGGYSYLSWPFAIAQLRQFDPSATWEVRRFEGLPYLNTDAGVFVEVAVTIQGITLSQIHPVLDGRNRPIPAPTVFDINTSIQRCLVKAIALHGLGLYIYAGEDLPEAGEDKPPVATAKAARKPKAVPTASVLPVTPTITPVAPPTAAIPDVHLDAEQVLAIREALTQHGSDEQRLLDYFGVATLEEIPATNYARVIRSIQNSRKAA